MIKSTILIVILTSFCLSGCADKQAKSSIRGDTKNNTDNAVIHYIGDQEAFAN